MEFWLERGVDGFRVDTVNMYSKGEMMDAPITDPHSEWQFAGFQYCNGPRMAEFLGEMNAILEKYDAMTVGECPNTPDMKRVLQYVSAKEKQLNMVFQFVSAYLLNPIILHFVTSTNIEFTGCRRRWPRSLQIPNHAQKLHTPRIQARNRPYPRLDPQPFRRMDDRFPREPRPIP
jgi:glycosidase